MILEIIVLIIILAGIMWVFGVGGKLAVMMIGGFGGLLSCLIVYIIFALIHKWVGPFIFGSG